MRDKDHRLDRLREEMTKVHLIGIRSRAIVVTRRKALEVQAAKV
jgi:hypothetical protein